MPKQIPQKCINCVKLNTEEARQKKCWIEKTCNKKRYYIKHRESINQKRNKKREIEILNIDLSEFENLYSSILIIYKSEKTKVITSIKVKNYRGNNLISETEKIEVSAMNKKQLYSLLDKIVQLLKAKYNLSKFTSMEVITY